MKKSLKVLLLTALLTIASAVCVFAEDKPAEYKRLTAQQAAEYLMGIGSGSDNGIVTACKWISEAEINASGANEVVTMFNILSGLEQKEGVFPSELIKAYTSQILAEKYVKLVTGGNPNQQLDSSIIATNDRLGKILPLVYALYNQTVAAQPVITPQATINGQPATIVQPQTAKTGKYVMLSDGSYFDPVYYAEMNPDVVKVYKTTDPKVMFHHYIKYGQFENRVTCRK